MQFVRVKKPDVRFEREAANQTGSATLLGFGVCKSDKDELCWLFTGVSVHLRLWRKKMRHPSANWWSDQWNTSNEGEEKSHCSGQTDAQEERSVRCHSVAEAFQLPWVWNWLSPCCYGETSAAVVRLVGVGGVKEEQQIRDTFLLDWKTQKQHTLVQHSEWVCVCQQALHRPAVARPLQGGRCRGCSLPSDLWPLASTKQFYFPFARQRRTGCVHTVRGRLSPRETCQRISGSCESLPCNWLSASHRVCVPKKLTIVPNKAAVECRVIAIWVLCFLSFPINS